MTKQYRNHNIRFNMTDEGRSAGVGTPAFRRVEQSFKSQNAFVVAAINDYYERHLSKKNDPYLESREKEDAFCRQAGADCGAETAFQSSGTCSHVSDATAGILSGGTTGWWDNVLSVSAGESAGCDPVGRKVIDGTGKCL